MAPEKRRLQPAPLMAPDAWRWRLKTAPSIVPGLPLESWRNGAGNGSWTGAWKLEKRRLQWRRQCRLQWRRQWRLDWCLKTRETMPSMALGLAPESWKWRLQWRRQWSLDWHQTKQHLKTTTGLTPNQAAPKNNHRTDAKPAPLHRHRSSQRCKEK